ncbi:hypothetical protein GLAREA_10906 [Glarea lozoyensis ATCC 20868]|uniref:Uncharacterized protein n=1 Tax=Glarea lozoyensis (strain ATCC 20868 / MF5171) TaxID=1116229 RepID=S3DDM8_GLAL2|nr:uncharacterized protein GLAREA_10906 [Glarea lozoyensis ATCC 20868]EPE35209.1 hypothetical protein GLAREA_10906 [Glarea lozoyensis ATCC 20868]
MINLEDRDADAIWMFVLGVLLFLRRLPESEWTTEYSQGSSDAKTTRSRATQPMPDFFCRFVATSSNPTTSIRINVWPNSINPVLSHRSSAKIIYQSNRRSGPRAQRCLRSAGWHPLWRRKGLGRERELKVGSQPQSRVAAGATSPSK